MRELSFIEQVKLTQKNLKTAEKVHKQNGRKFDANVYSLWWRTRNLCVYLFQKQQISLYEHTHQLHTLGPTLRQWREKGQTTTDVTHHIIEIAIRTNSPVRLSQVEEACRYLCGRSAVNTILQNGVKLKLLKSTKTGYRLTKLMMDELEVRCLNFNLTEEMINLARHICMYDDALRAFESSDNLTNQGAYTGNMDSLYNRILKGNYPDEDAEK